MLNSIHNPLLQTLIGPILSYPYVAIFIALIFGGETVLIPVIFIGIRGNLELSLIFLTAIIATIIADTVWYCIGKYTPLEKLKELKVVKKRNKEFQELSDIFSRHNGKILLASKAIYGTRIAVQIISGSRAMPFLKYISINTLGVVVWTLFLIMVGLVTSTTASRLGGVADVVGISFAVFVVLVVLAMILFKKIAPRWLR